MNIHSIYLATEGEGIHIGRPQVFVRFQGCNIGCINCDSKETWSFEANIPMTINQVIEQIDIICQGRPPKWVSITGGDPLHPKNINGAIELAKRLKELGKKVNVEAAGTRIPHELFDIVDYISFDVKTPKTNVATPEKNLIELVTHYPSKYQIKAVIEDEIDFNYAYNLYLKLENELGQELNWVLTPCYKVEEEFPRDRFIEIINLNETNGGLFKVIGQQHKWFYGPSKLNV